MAADLGRLVATLEARAERFDLTLQRATGRLDDIARKTESANERMSRSSSRLQSVMSGVGKGFAALVAGATAAGAAIGVFAVRQFQALDKLGDLAQQTGLTATSLRQLQVGLELNGGTAEQASEGLLTFSRNLGQVEAGTGRLTGLLKKLDPAFLQALKNAGSTEEGLNLIADRIAAARSEQEALTIATAAFGPAGRQFVLLMRDGAEGVAALQKELESIGIDNLDEVTAAAQRFDDRLKLLRAAVTAGFQKGLFGIGEGLESISDALDDDTIRRIGEMATSFGELAASLASFSLEKLEAFGEIMKAQRLAGLEDALESTTDAIDEAKSRIIELDEALADLGDTGGELPAAAGFFDLEAKNRRSEIEALRRERAEEEARLARAQASHAAAQSKLRPPNLAPAGGRGGLFDISGIRERASIAPPGAKAPDAAMARASVAFEREQDAFLRKMQEAARGPISEAEKLRIELTDRLAKIDEAVQKGTLTLAASMEFRQAAIREAADAIQTAELEAFEKQNAAVESFLERFGSASVSEAEKIAAQVQDALDKIPDLDPERRKALEQEARPRQERARTEEIGAAQRELIRREITVESDSLFGATDAIERELARAEAIVEASQLAEKLKTAYGASPEAQAELEAALAKNAELLDQQLANIESNWAETWTKVSDLGTQVFDDFLQGIAEGSDAAFEDMARAFLLGLAKMEAAALATDLKAALFQGGAEPTSLIGQGIGALADGFRGEKSPEKDADEAEAAAESISSQLLGALEGGAASLLDAGKSAGSAIIGAGQSLLAAGLKVAAEIAAALAAQAAVGTAALFGLKEGGAAVPRGVVRLDRIPALAQGGYVAPRIERIERLSERIAPTLRLAEGGSVSKVERVYREVLSGSETEKTHELIQSLTTRERAQLTERLQSHERIESAGRDISRVLDRSTTTKADRIQVLVGEAGTERLLTMERIREIAAQSGGDPVRAVQIAKQTATKLDRPEIRELSAGDVVIPDRKLTGFFDRVMPKHRAASGGWAPLAAMRPVEKAVADSSGDGVEFNLTMVNESGVSLGVKKKQIRQSGRRIDALFVVGQTGATDIRTGGEMSREAQRSWGVRVAPRET